MRLPSRALLTRPLGSPAPGRLRPRVRTLSPAASPARGGGGRSRDACAAQAPGLGRSGRPRRVIGRLRGRLSYAFPCRAERRCSFSSAPPPPPHRLATGRVPGVPRRFTTPPHRQSGAGSGDEDGAPGVAAVTPGQERPAPNRGDTPPPGRGGPKPK